MYCVLRTDYECDVWITDYEHAEELEYKSLHRGLLCVYLAPTTIAKRRNLVFVVYQMMLIVCFYEILHIYSIIAEIDEGIMIRIFNLVVLATFATFHARRRMSMN